VRTFFSLKGVLQWNCEQKTGSTHKNGGKTLWHFPICLDGTTGLVLPAVHQTNPLLAAHLISLKKSLPLAVLLTSLKKSLLLAALPAVLGTRSNSSYESPAGLSCRGLFKIT
jgi:hypothetical protein